MSRWRNSTGYQRFALLTIVGVLALITLGGAVRVTDSGLACPDWPLCNGQAIPRGDYHVWIEWTHRLVASLVGLAIVVVVVGAWRAYRNRPWVVLPLTAVILVLLVQVVLGGLTVTEDLPVGIITAHLATAMIIVLLLMGGWLATFAPPPHRQDRRPVDLQARRIARLAVASAVGVFALVLLGSYVTGTEAGYACSGWPLCNQAYLPDGRLANIQVSHRYLAAAVGLVILATVVMGWRSRRAGWPAAWLSLSVALLYLAQVVIGAAQIWTTLADWARVLHLAAATALWAAALLLLAIAAERAAWLPNIGRRGPLPRLFPRWMSVKESPAGD